MIVVRFLRKLSLIKFIFVLLSLISYGTTHLQKILSFVHKSIFLYRRRTFSGKSRQHWSERGLPFLCVFNRELKNLYASIKFWKSVSGSTWNQLNRSQLRGVQNERASERKIWFWKNCQRDAIFWWIYFFGHPDRKCFPNSCNQWFNYVKYPDN